MSREWDLFVLNLLCQGKGVCSKPVVSREKGSVCSKRVVSRERGLVVLNVLCPRGRSLFVLNVLCPGKGFLFLNLLCQGKGVCSFQTCCVKVKESYCSRAVMSREKDIIASGLVCQRTKIIRLSQLR